MAWEPNYAAVEELQDYVRIPDDVDDAQIALAITAASRAIDDATHRQFGQEDAPRARYYTPRLSHTRGRWVADIDDLTDVTGLAVRFDSDDDGSYASTITAYRLTPANAAADRRPWTRLEVLAGEPTPVCGRPDGLEVTALFGWPTVPDAIKQACLLQASRLLSRRDAPFGVAGSPETGSEVRLLAQLDPDVKVAVRRYVRWRKRTG